MTLVARPPERSEDRATPCPRVRPARSAAFFTALRTIAAGALLLSILRAEIEFVGILAVPSITRFALSDTATAKTNWVSLGDTFAEHKVTAYDRASDTLTLVKAGVPARLRLKEDARIKSSRIDLTGTITLGTDEPVEIERATLLLDQENVFSLKDGVVYRITPTRRGDGTLLYRISMERPLAANKTEKVLAPAVVTLAGQPFKLSVGDAGFAFTPR